MTTRKGGRPKIEGLESFNLRILGSQRAELDRIVASEREVRAHPSLTVTDVVREFIAKGIASHAKRR